MGLFACFAPPAVVTQSKQQVQQLTGELSAAQAHVAQLQGQLQQVQADRAHLELQLSRVPVKHDAATEMPSISIAVQAKPPVMLESRIPQPTGEDAAGTASSSATTEVAVKSRIPMHPADSPVKNNSNRTTKESACESPMADSAGLIRAVAARACADGQRGSATDPSSLQAAGSGNAAEMAELEQRIVLLQQQLKVADAFRASLEAQLRDARFANSNLQTQVLSLQTKFEKTIEDQVLELEKLNQLRKEGQERYHAVVSEVQEHRKLQDPSAAGQLAAFKAEAVAAVQRAVDSEVKLAGVMSELQETQQELQESQQELESTKAQLHSTEQLVEHTAEQARLTVTELELTIEKLEEELRSQKAIYDSTVEEMLQLSSNYNELKQDYHKLQSETKNHDEMVQLVQQELAELSYYAAAGRVALGIAPESCLRNFSTSEVMLAPRERTRSDGYEAHLSNLKLSGLLSQDSTRLPAVAAVLAGRERTAGESVSEAVLVAPEAVVPTVQEADEEAAAQE